jgi:hypothetical protein
MSKIHLCNDGTQDITGKGTPNKIPCENQGGEIGGYTGSSTPLGLKTSGYMGIPKIGWIAIIGVLGYYAYTKGMFK